MGGPFLRPQPRAFTLIDVLVTMAVVTVLISLLAPSLTSVRETANQVICRSNTRQVGIAINQFADANDDSIPRSLVATTPWETMTLRFGENNGNLSGRWDGLGVLYSTDYLSAPKIFYCPSHKGRSPFKAYEDHWANIDTGTMLVGNYQYRGQGPVSGSPAGMLNPPQTVFLSKMRSSTTLVCDGLRDQASFNHIVGANLLRADLSVRWYGDGGRLFELLPKEGEASSTTLMQQAWQELDRR